MNLSMNRHKQVTCSVLGTRWLTTKGSQSNACVLKMLHVVSRRQDHRWGMEAGEVTQFWGWSRGLCPQEASMIPLSGDQKVPSPAQRPGSMFPRQRAL